MDEDAEVGRWMLSVTVMYVFSDGYQFMIQFNKSYLFYRLFTSKQYLIYTSVKLSWSI